MVTGVLALAAFAAGGQVNVLNALPGQALHTTLRSLGLGTDDARTALTSFRGSCSRLTTRADVSGLTKPDDWKPACAATLIMWSSLLS